MGWSRYFRRKRWDTERASEIESYLDIETADNVARGMTADEARRTANRKLGNTTLIREEIYHMNSIGWLELLLHDIRYALRMLRKGPGTSVVALLSLALGIGTTTAMFSVIYCVLISPYPYAKPNEIWATQVHDVHQPARGFSAYHLRDFLEVRKLSAFSDSMATAYQNELLSGEHGVENFTGVLLTPNAFRFLGVAPVLGRTIQPSDLRPGGEPERVIVLSYGAWQRLFSGSPDALGKTLVLDDIPRTVIGVMPPRFGWFTNDGGWLPMPMTLHDDLMVAPIMRLRPGVAATAAAEQLHSLNLELAKAHPENFPKARFATALINYMDVTVASGSTMRSSLTLLFGAVGFLLLIACANVANLQMARAASRAHEIAVRMSIGAARGRVFRQLLTESVVLSLAGGVLGVLFALGITRAIVALMPDFYVPNEARITVNAYALLFSAGVSVLTGILFGLVPALRCSRPDLVGTLKDAGRTGAGATGGRARNVLVVVEVAMAVVLLVGASLTIRGFINLQRLDLGFQPERVLMVSLQLPPKRYATYEQRIAFTQSVLRRVSALPGVESAAIGNGGLPFGGPQSPFSIAGHPQADTRRILVGLTSPGYAKTLGIALRAGREMSEQEVARAAPVALINETAAKLWPAGESPIGGHLRLDLLAKPPGALVAPGVSADVEVIGILADTRNDGLQNPPMPASFVPYTLVAPTGRIVAVRTRSEQPMLLLNAVRGEVRALDKDQPLSRPITMEEVLGFETAQPRFNMALFTFFGVLGLAIAAIGIYSVLSYTVARRTHEIGIRMALGAGRSHVLRLMLRMGARLAASGLAVGLAGSFILTKLIRSEVFRVPATDPLAILGVVLILGTAAVLACLAPSLRAARLDPLSALRHD
jgi:putative ABC transport system permease protein